jgi:hypothetical protein
LELRNGSLTGAGARTTLRLLCSAAVAICATEATTRAEPKIVKIVFRIVNLPCWAFSREANGISHVSALSLHITMTNANYYGAAHHETASQFLGQKFFRLNIQQPDPARL